MPVYLGIMAGTATLSALLTFYKNYKASKSISEDPEEPTTLDDYNGPMCDGYRISVASGSGTLTSYYAQSSLTFLGVNYYGLEPYYYDPDTGLYGGFEYSWNGNNIRTSLSVRISEVLGFGVKYYQASYDSKYYLSASIIYRKSDGGLYGYTGLTTDWPRTPSSYERTCSTASVSQSTQAAIDLETWNANIDWLEDLIDSGSTDGVSIDSDSYTEVTDPDELADTIMDAITDNDYEGTLAEIPEPINYATTVKAALDDTYTSLGTNDLTVVSVPASSSATGSVGQIAFDSTYIYLCTATDTWVRTAISTWT